MRLAYNCSLSILHFLFSFRLQVTLYDEDGFKICVLSPDDAHDIVEPLCPALVPYSAIYGVVTEAKDTFITSR